MSFRYPQLSATAGHRMAAACALLLAGCAIPTYWPRPAEIDFEFNAALPTSPLRPPDAAVFVTEPVFESIPDKTGSHAPTITAFPDGELLVAWYSYRGPGELRGSALYFTRRPAGATLWDPPALHRETAGGIGNPVLYSEGDAVWLFQAVTLNGWATAHVEVQRSFDRGFTWSEPRRIRGPLGANVRFPPVRTTEGDLLLPAYCDLVHRALFFDSDDGDEWTWRSVVDTDPPHHALQPSMTVLSSGRLLAVLRHAEGGGLWVTASDDDGRSWTVPRDSGFPNPASPAALLRLANGHLLLVYNDSAEARHPLSITASADDGRTWQPTRVLVDGAGDYAYPAAVEAADGRVHFVYSHDRERIQHIALNETWVATGNTERR